MIVIPRTFMIIITTIINDVVVVVVVVVLRFLSAYIVCVCVSQNKVFSSGYAINNEIQFIHHILCIRIVATTFLSFLISLHRIARSFYTISDPYCSQMLFVFLFFLFICV